MRKKTLLGLSVMLILIFIIILVVVQFSKKDQIKGFENRLKNNGYEIQEIQKPVSINVHIKPEWIANKTENTKKVEVTILEKNNTKIILENVQYRENDIYFTFKTSTKINKDDSVFLSNNVFNADGTSHAYAPNNLFEITTSKKEIIPLGQIAFEENSGFSFGVPVENYHSIKNGFDLKYSGFILYSYFKN
ncbi:hypothetical protein AWU65_14720 [Paenibacillus glucanolyticus]|uniref:Uncharacterized protein n=1 Tax=Paenibacillus glucanolyticus TaxID=59843 RepID=A0A163KA67_9BACL|nr:hypothetical protein [Paenibacillus glucanolyticus]KZS47088.1 hypothetical protein AWU65_14720 [Paenibacillus glucanolyticus]